MTNRPPAKNYTWLLVLLTFLYMFVVTVFVRADEVPVFEFKTSAAEKAAEKAEKPKGPALLVTAHPAMALALAGSGAGVVIKVQITGLLNEGWYCPEVTWLWPDETKSVEESDCVVWEDAFLEGAVPQTRWDRGRVFPPGDWPVTVELKKAGKLVARQTVLVRVVG